MPHQVRIKYNIPDEIGLVVDIAKDGLTVITSPDLPGFITQAKGNKNIVDMVNDAILTYFDVPKKECNYYIVNVKIGGRVLIVSDEQKQKITV